MEEAKQATYLVLFICSLVQASELPVEKCTLTDKACVIPAFQKMLPVFINGMPKYGIEIMDPLAMNDAELEFSGLIFNLSNSTLNGLKTVVFDNIDWDVKNKVITWDFHMDCTLTSQYTADGEVMFLAVAGDGQINMNFKNVKIKTHLHYDLVKNGDKDFVKVKTYDYDYEIQENPKVSITNLFSGNRDLSKPLMRFLNSNWNQFSGEFGGPLVDNILKKIFKDVGYFFDKMPIADIANV